MVDVEFWGGFLDGAVFSYDKLSADYTHEIKSESGTMLEKYITSRHASGKIVASYIGIQEVSRESQKSESCHSMESDNDVE